MIDLAGMHVLVTGGNRGIGAATARLFARAGAAVLIQYREREAEAEALVDELYSISDQQHRRFPCDFLQPAEIVELFQFVASEWGKLDCLINNAGVWQHNPMSQFDEDRYISTMRVNVSGPFHCLREALPFLRLSKQANVINISSGPARRGVLQPVRGVEGRHDLGDQGLGDGARAGHPGQLRGSGMGRYRDVRRGAER